MNSFNSIHSYFSLWKNKEESTYQIENIFSSKRVVPKYSL